MFYELSRMLVAQINSVSALVKTLKKALARAPRGTIYTFRSHGSLEYQFVGEDKKRNYIPKKNERQIRSLLQKKYDKKLVKKLEKLLAVMIDLNQCLDPESLSRLFDDLPEECKSLIDDRGISDAEFIKQWAEEEYTRKEIGSNVPEFITNRGERVRSKSEKIIADMLNDKGLAYRYEESLYLDGYGTIHSDFKILHPRKRTIVCLEHNGMMDDPNYSGAAAGRINAYERNGYYEGDQLLLTFETSTRPLDTETLSKKLDHFFFDL